MKSKSRGKINYNSSSKLSDTTGGIPGDKSMEINAGSAGTPGYKKGGKITKVKGKKSKPRLDKMSRGGKFIQKMNMKKGALHKELGVPEGKKIPEKKLEKAENSSNPKLRKRAVLAETLKGLRKK